MKAKDLAKILMATPEAEVVYNIYDGCGEPLISVNTVKHESKGEKTCCSDGGEFTKDGIVEEDIVILYYDPNIQGVASIPYTKDYYFDGSLNNESPNIEILPQDYFLDKPRNDGFNLSEDD